MVYKEDLSDLPEHLNQRGYQKEHRGFAAWWLLQHTRNYKPFVTKIFVKIDYLEGFKVKKYLCIIMVLSHCFSCKRNEISFVPLIQFDHVDTLSSQGGTYISKQVSYIVNNYNDNAIKAVDSCAYVVAGNNPSKFANYTIIFYKASGVTNIANLGKNPRDIDRYSQENDLLLVYRWVNGKFVGKSYEGH